MPFELLLQQGSQQLQLLQESNIPIHHPASASAIITGTCVFAAIIVIHKKKNNKNYKPQNCTAFALAAVFAAK